jgi:hypothetical protein
MTEASIQKYESLDKKIKLEEILKLRDLVDIKVHRANNSILTIITRMNELDLELAYAKGEKEATELCLAYIDDIIKRSNKNGSDNKNE